MDTYKTQIIDGQIRALKEDEYNLVQLVGPGGKNINLDEGALLLLKRYYSQGTSDISFADKQEAQ